MVAGGGLPYFFCNSRNRATEVDVVEAGTVVGPEEDDMMMRNELQKQNPGPVGTGTTTVPEGDAEPPIDVGSSFRAAYEKRLMEITAVPDAELVRLNLDVRSTVATVLGALPEINALRSAMSELARLNQSYVDGLEEYALAAAEANSRYVIAMKPPEDINPLNEKAIALRETLKSDATALAHRGLIAEERLLPFRGLVGFKNVAFELIDWANLLRDSWPQIQGKTALTAEELAGAKLVGERLVRLAGLREQAPAVVAEVARIRKQAVTLLVNAYNEVRRAVGYLRWNEGDADTIAPSLYADGRGKRAQPTPAPAPEAEPAKAPGPAPIPNAPPLNGPSASAPVAPLVAPGLPGASPFAPLNDVA